MLLNIDANFIAKMNTMNEINYTITPLVLIFLIITGVYIYRKAKFYDNDSAFDVLKKHDEDNINAIFQLAESFGLIQGYYPNNLDKPILLFHKSDIIFPLIYERVEIREKRLSGFSVYEICNKKNEVLALLAISTDIWVMHNPERYHGYSARNFIFPQLIIEEDEQN